MYMIKILQNMDSLRKSIGVKSNYQSIYENKNLKDI